MKIILLALVFTFVNQNVFGENECCEEYCYSQDRERPQTRQYGTKTAYEVVKGTNYGRQYEVPNCVPTKFWLLSRHGTRLPSKKTINGFSELEGIRDEIYKNYKQRRTGPDTGGLCTVDQYLINSWKANYTITEQMENELTSQGWIDLVYLARNYKKNYPNILQKEYDSQHFLFRHTNTQRTTESFKAFTEGLFGPGASSFINLSPPPVNDTLLRPYEFCPAWQEQDAVKDDKNSEIYKFENSAIFIETIGDISSRLGFKYSLEKDQIDQIWDMCRYEQAWHVDRSSAWCAAFTPSQVTVLEYYEDLKYYYKSGYGSELNTRVTCAAVKDMLQHLNNSNPPETIAYFTHSSAVQMFLVALGIQEDKEPLRADNYNQMKNRKWKTSISGPFASNLAAIKYECNDDANEKEKVIFFLNQLPVELDWCKVGLCNWSDVMKKYKRFFDADCDEYYCANSATKFKTSFLSLLIALVIYLTK